MIFEFLRANAKAGHVTLSKCIPKTVFPLHVSPIFEDECPGRRKQSSYNGVEFLFIKIMLCNWLVACEKAEQAGDTKRRNVK